MARKNVTPLLFFLILLTLVFSFASVIFGYNQLNEVKSKIDTISANTANSQKTSATGNPDLQSLDSRISSLELLQQSWVEASKGALEQMNFVFAIVAAFFGLFGLFFAYRQMVADNSKDEKDAEMRSLVSSFQNNITTINSLIVTLEKSFAFRGEVQLQLSEINRRANSLEETRNESDAIFTQLTNELNELAVKMFSAEVDRRQDLNNEDVSRKLNDVAEKMNHAAQSRNIDTILNPFCFYIRGLSYVNVYQYELAISDLSTAERKGSSDLANTNKSAYAAHHRIDIDKKINEMLVRCSYFQGVSYKNLGRYEECRSKFKEAIAKDPNNFESKCYILQSLFFDSNMKFDEIENEYRKATEEFSSLLKGDNNNRDRIKKALSTLKVYEGNMYLKKLILHDSRSGYKHYENQEKALKCYWGAYDLDNNEITSFCVAQAMRGVGAYAHRAMNPQKLYEESFSMLKKKISEDHDYLYSVTLYYMLAICASEISHSKDSVEIFLSQARHSLKQVPTNVTCFSPISKIRLSRYSILEEMENFEKTP